MIESELVANQVVLGEWNYEAAIDIVIAEAQEELLIFDENLAKGNYKGLKRFNLIQDFLNKVPHSRLTMVLHRTDYFTHECPRLFALLKIYGHKMMVYTTNDEAKVAKDTFVVADKKHYVRRFHIDQARFKYNLNDAQNSADIVNRFNELLQQTQETVTPTNLGL